MCPPSPPPPKILSTILEAGGVVVLANRSVGFIFFFCIFFSSNADRRKSKPVAERVAGAQMERHARRDGDRDQNHHRNDLRQGGRVHRAGGQHVPHRGDRRAVLEHSNDQLREYCCVISSRHHSNRISMT